MKATLNGTLLRGRDVALSRDGVLTLRLGQSIVQLEMQGHAPADILGKSVAIVIQVLDLYPTGI